MNLICEHTQSMASDGVIPLLLLQNELFDFASSSYGQKKVASYYYVTVSNEVFDRAFLSVS
jgi:hypothetical protein